MLAEVPVRDRATKGGTITASVPIGTSGLVQADGWLDWRTPATYLATSDPDTARSSLVRADRAAVLFRDGAQSGPPPLRPPTDAWTQSRWSERADEPDSDLFALLRAALDAGSGVRGDSTSLRAAASWLRSDSVDGVPVEVFEIRGSAETVPGQARLRYWVGHDGVLRRLEIRTAAGGYGYLDVTLGTVPVLPRPVVTAGSAPPISVPSSSSA